MRRTYRATVFACFYFAILLGMSAIWFTLCGHLSAAERTWGTVILIAFGIFGAPFLRAKVTVDDEGIEQRIYRRRYVRWADVISWERRGSPNSEGPETIRIDTSAGSFTLNHNCIYGIRLDKIEAELRSRIVQRQGGPTGRGRLPLRAG